MVGIDRERHQLVEGHLVGGIGVEQRLADGGEPQPLFDDVDRDEECRGDLLLAHAFLAHGLEGAELVERMQRRALDVLGQTVFFGETVGADRRRDRRGLVQPLLLHQQFERAEAAATGGHLEHAGLVAILVGHRPDGQALQERTPGDVLGEFLDRDTGFDAPDIRLAEDEFVEGNIARHTERDLGLGLDVGHRFSPRRAARRLSLDLQPVTKTPPSSSSQRGLPWERKGAYPALQFRGHETLHFPIRIGRCPMHRLAFREKAKQIIGCLAGFGRGADDGAIVLAQDV